MNSYIVIAKFKDDVTPDEIRAHIPAEQAQARVLEEKGLLGFIKVAMPKRTVFIEAFAHDDQGVLDSINSLPFSKLWNFEIYATTPPAGSNF